MIPPDDFIPLIEDAGLITAFTPPCCAKAVHDAKYWPADLTLALNVTPAQISDLQLPKMLSAFSRPRTFRPSGWSSR